MKLSKISKRIVAVVSALAMVIAGIAYTPATTKAMELPEGYTYTGFVGDEGGWVYSDSTVGFKGFYGGIWNGGAQRANIGVKYDTENPYTLDLYVLENTNNGDWLTQATVAYGDLEANKPYTFAIKEGDETLVSEIVTPTDTTYEKTYNLNGKLTEGQHTLVASATEVIDDGGEVEVQPITITPNEEAITNYKNIWATWTVPEGTAKAYAYLGEVAEGNGVATANNGWIFNTAAGQPMISVDKVAQTQDGKVKVEAGETYTLIVQSFNAFGVQNGEGTVEITIPGKTDEEIAAEEALEDINDPDLNFALNKAPIVAEGNKEAEAVNLVDGNKDTRWQANKAVDNTFFAVDLGAVYSIDEVLVSWEASNATAYEIYTSLDGENYELAAEVSGLVNNLARPVLTIINEDDYTDARFVKIVVTGWSENAGNFGVSAYELAVFGDGAVEDETSEVEPTSEAVEPTSEAVEPTTEATEPTSEAVEPTTDSTEPTTEATEPTSEDVEPTTVAPYDPGFDPSTLDFIEATSGDETIKYAVKDDVTGLAFAYLDNGITFQAAFSADLGKATSVTINGEADSAALVLNDMGIIKVNPTLMDDDAYTVVEATFESGQVLTFVVKKGTPAEVDPTTEATEPTTEATEPTTEAVEPTTAPELDTLVPDTDVAVDAWTEVGDYSVYTGSWGNGTAKVAECEDDSSHIAVQQVTSNWSNAWVTQVMLELPELTEDVAAGKVYTVYWPIVAKNNDGVLQMDGHDGDIALTGDYQVLEGKLKIKNDTQQAACVIGMGWIPAGNPINFYEPVVVDEDGNIVYPDQEEDIELDTLISTLEDQQDVKTTLGGYDVSARAFNNTSLIAGVTEFDEDYVAFKMLSSNNAPEGLTFTKTITGLEPNTEYDASLAIYSELAGDKIYGDILGTDEFVETEAEDWVDLEGKVTSDENGELQLTLYLGNVQEGNYVEIEGYVLTDENGDVVYPVEEEDTTTEAPTEVTTEETTEAPTETTTEAPTEVTTVAPTQATTVAPTQATTAKKTVAKPAKVKIKKVYKKKKSAKKLKLKLKKAKNAKGYQVAVYKSKKNAKKNKKALVKKYSKKVKVTIKSKKLKGKKKLFVKARAYNLDGQTKKFGAWSKVKKVKVK